MAEDVVDAEIVADDASPSSHELVPQTATAAVTLFGTDDPAAVIERATAHATALADVVRQRELVMRIGKGEHVMVEGWTLLGSMLGVFPVTVWTREIGDPDGWEARVEARTLAGAVVGAAEAQCDRSEGKWRDRDGYALRSMAQTRATSKALRMPLGFVMQLAGFSPTPAEEMPAQQTDARPARPSSAAQQGKIHALLGEHDVDDREYREILAKLYGVGSSKELSGEQASQLISTLASDEHRAKWVRWARARLAEEAAE